MVSATAYIKSLQARLRNAYKMTTLTGVKEEPLKNMARQIDNRVEVKDAMRDRLE